MRYNALVFSKTAKLTRPLGERLFYNMSGDKIVTRCSLRCQGENSKILSFGGRELLKKLKKYVQEFCKDCAERKEESALNFFLGMLFALLLNVLFRF